MRADMILLDGSAENMLPGPDPLADAVYSAQGMNVALTMVNGRILYEDGKFTTFRRGRGQAQGHGIRPMHSG